MDNRARVASSSRGHLSLHGYKFSAGERIYSRAIPQKSLLVWILVRKHKFDPRDQRQYSSSFRYSTSNHSVRRLNVRLKCKASENVTTRRINVSPLLVLLDAMQNCQTRLFDAKRYPFNQFLEKSFLSRVNFKRQFSKIE